MKRTSITASALISLLFSSLTLAISPIQRGSCPEPLREPKSLTIKPGVLRVGTSIPADGYEFLDPVTGKADGYDIRVACLFAHCIGAKLEIVNSDLSSLVSGVESGAFDIALSDLNSTEALLKLVEMVPYTFFTRQTTAPLFFRGSLPTGVTSGTGDHLTQLDHSSVSNKTVGVVTGSAEEEVLDYVIRHGLSSLVKASFATLAEGVAALNSGAIIAFFGRSPSDVTGADIIVTETTIPDALTLGPVSAAIRRNHCDLINAFANFVRINEGKLRALAEEFTPQDVHEETVPTFTPQVCHIKHDDPCRFAKCPFARHIADKFCPVTGSCEFKFVDLVATA